MHNEDGEPLCFVDRYDTTGPVVAVSRDEAAARMRADLLADVAWCIIVPSVLGIVALCVLARLLAGDGVVAGGDGIVENVKL